MQVKKLTLEDMDVALRYITPMGRVCALLQVHRNGESAQFEYRDGDREGVPDGFTLRRENVGILRVAVGGRR